jgi:hypothetical protein
MDTASISGLSEIEPSRSDTSEADEVQAHGAAGGSMEETHVMSTVDASENDATRLEVSVDARVVAPKPPEPSTVPMETVPGPPDDDPPGLDHGISLDGSSEDDVDETTNESASPAGVLDVSYESVDETTVSEPPRVGVDVTVDDRYYLEAVIGQGGMGTVYRALDRRLHDRPCALKVLSPQHTDPHWFERFSREIRTISSLRSPHTVQITDVGEVADGRPYIVMELLEGRPLAADLRRGPMPEAQAVRVIDGVLASLGEAHAQGVVHRDLKPPNIFLMGRPEQPAVAKVLDFGVAKNVDADGEDLTEVGQAIGTPKYMAPEQFRGLPVDGRTDLYVCGVLMYAMVAGRAPFERSGAVPDAIAHLPDATRLGWQHLHAEPVRPEGMSDPIWAWTCRALAKSPSDRHPDAASARAGLRETPVGSGTLAPLLTSELPHLPVDVSAPRSAPAQTGPRDAPTEPSSRRQTEAAAEEAKAMWWVAGSAAVTLAVGVLWWFFW